MRRLLILTLAAGLLAACGDDSDDEPEANDTPAEAPADDAAAAPADDPADEPAVNGLPEMVTIADLDVDLPFAIPGEIPAPSDAEYIGEATNAAPYSAVQFSTGMDAEALRAELAAFAADTDANFDEAIDQVTYLTEIDGVQHNVYAWVRTVEGDAVLEVGIIEIPE